MVAPREIKSNTTRCDRGLFPSDCLLLPLDSVVFTVE
jgi:hypothetical protein